MIQTSFGPGWFIFPSIMIDFIAFFVLLMISSFSFKYYKLNKKNKNYLYLAWSFLLICFSFGFKILTNLTIYYPIFRDTVAGPVVNAMASVRQYNIFSFLTFSGFVLCHLLGLFFLYAIYNKDKHKTHLFLIAYFILLSTYLSHLNYYIFHLTALFFLAILSLIYLRKYSNNGYDNTKKLYYSFSILALSHLFFMFISVNQYFYVMAETIQLIGYLLLLFILSTVVNYGKKKK
jgi:hypothetical protein